MTYETWRILFIVFAALTVFFIVLSAVFTIKFRFFSLLRSGIANRKNTAAPTRPLPDNSQEKRTSTAQVNKNDSQDYNVPAYNTSGTKISARSIPETSSGTVISGTQTGTGTVIADTGITGTVIASHSDTGTVIASGTERFVITRNIVAIHTDPSVIDSVLAGYSDR